MVKILTVCTGNICRSPFAERYLQTHLDSLAPGRFEVSSAGTQALTGKPMDRQSAEFLALEGVNADGFGARQLNETMLAEVDFVLALTVEHRNMVLARSPRMLKRAFTVREFARVLEAVQFDADISLPRGGEHEDIAARWKVLPKLAALKRHLAPAARTGDDDVVDPYRRPPEVYEQMIDELLPSLRAIVAFEAAAIR